MSQTQASSPAGKRSIARRIVGRIRKLNRRWIDWLDPSTSEAGSWAPVDDVTAKPAAPAPAKPAQPAFTVRREETPNPDAMKFVCNRKVVETGSLSFSNARAAEGHPLGRAVFQVDGVKSLFAVNDFVTVTRRTGEDWDRMGPQIEHQLGQLFFGA